MRLALDIDDVICDFTAGIFRVAGVPIENATQAHSYDYKEVLEFAPIWEKVKDDEEFWLSLPVRDGYIPSCCKAFLSARYCSPKVTAKWLKRHGLWGLPLYQRKDKLQALRDLNLEGLVDDKAETFLEVRGDFPSSFLVSNPWNRHISTPNRIGCLQELDWRVSHGRG